MTKRPFLRSLSSPGALATCLLALPAFRSLAATVNVAAGNASALSTAVKNAKPGDTIVLLGGTYNTGISTSVNGTAAAPITIEGLNGATLNNTSLTGEGIEVNNNYYVFQNIAINGFQESFRTDAASYCVANNITATGSKIEAFKFKNTSTHWLVENCTVNNSGMEGFYCGDANQNWTGGVPDATSNITFYHDVNNVNFNDGFDFKEGTSNIRVIGCQTDWQNTTPGGNNEGDSGAYIRNDNTQVLNYTVLNNGSAGNAARVQTSTVSNITYGSHTSLYGLVANNIQGSFLDSTQSNTTLYTNYSLTNVTGGLLESGSHTPTTPDPSTFVENTWSSAGGVFNEGAFLPITLTWNNAHSAVGDGSSWNFTQQNFDDIGTNGDIPAMFFPAVAVAFNDNNNGHYAVTLTTTLSPGAITVNNSAGDYTFSGNGSITGNTTLSKSGSGNLTLRTNNTYTGATSIAAGTLIFAPSLSTNSSTNTLNAITGTGGSLTIAANATLSVTTVVLNATTTHANDLLTINGTLQLRANSGTSAVSALTITPTAGLDVTNNTLILQSTAAAKPAALAALQSALHTTAHTGLYSSTLTTNTALAIVDNGALLTPFTTFAGRSVTPNSLLITPALLGDTNLSGTVDLNDLNTVLNHLGQTTPNWTDGNFDNAATIDLNDLNAVLNHLGTSNLPPNVATAESLLATQNVPEPASLALLLTALPLVAAKRRRRNGLC